MPFFHCSGLAPASKKTLLSESSLILPPVIVVLVTGFSPPAGRSLSIGSDPLNMELFFLLHHFPEL